MLPYGRKYQPEFSDIWFIVLKGSGVRVFAKTTTTTTKKVAWVVMNGPWGPTHFPEIYDTGTHARAQRLYVKKKSSGPSHIRVYYFYFEAAIEFSRNSSVIRGNAL